MATSPLHCQGRSEGKREGGRDLVAGRRRPALRGLLLFFAGIAMSVSGLARNLWWANSSPSLPKSESSLSWFSWCSSHRRRRTIESIGKKNAPLEFEDSMHFGGNGRTACLPLLSCSSTAALAKSSLSRRLHCTLRTACFSAPRRCPSNLTTRSKSMS